MAIGERTAQTVDQQSGNLSISKPTGTAENDWLLCGFTNVDSGTGASEQILTAPSGWTLLGFMEVPKTWVWIKKAGASEPTSYSWSASSTTWCGWIQAYSGALGIFECKPWATNESSATVNFQSIKTHADGCKIVDIAGGNAGGTASSPSSGFTEEADLGTGLFDTINLYVQSKTVSTASTEASRSITRNTNQFSSFSVVIVPDTESDYRPPAGEFVVRGIAVSSQGDDTEIQIPGYGLSDLDGDVGVTVAFVGDSGKGWESVTGWTKRSNLTDTGSPDVSAQVYTKLMDGTETAGASEVFSVTAGGLDTSCSTCIVLRGGDAWTSDPYVSDQLDAEQGTDVTVSSFTVTDNDSAILEFVGGDQTALDHVTTSADWTAAAQLSDTFVGGAFRTADSGASSTNTWNFNSPSGSADLWVVAVEIGPAPTTSAQTVELTHFDGQGSIHNQTVTIGAVTVELNHFDGEGSIHNLSVEQVVALQHFDGKGVIHALTAEVQPVEAVIQHFDGSPTAHELSISPGAITAEIQHFDGEGSIHLVTVTTSVTAELQHFDGQGSIHNLDVSQVATLQHFDGQGSAHNLSVTTGAVTAEIQHFDGQGSAHNLAVSPGAVTTEIQHFDGEGSIHQVTVTIEGFVELQHFDGQPTAHNLDVSPGAITTELAHFDGIGSVHNLSVSYVVALQHFDGQPSAHNLSVSPGAVTTELSHFDGQGSIHLLTVTQPALEVELSHFDGQPTAHNLSVTTGAVTVELTHFDGEGSVHALQASQSGVVSLEHFDGQGSIHLLEIGTELADYAMTETVSTSATDVPVPDRVEHALRIQNLDSSNEVWVSLVPSVTAAAQNDECVIVTPGESYLIQHPGTGATISMIAITSDVDVLLVSERLVANIPG